MEYLRQISCCASAVAAIPFAVVFSSKIHVVSTKNILLKEICTSIEGKAFTSDLQKDSGAFTAFYIYCILGYTGKIEMRVGRALASQALPGGVPRES